MPLGDRVTHAPVQLAPMADPVDRPFRAAVARLGAGRAASAMPARRVPPTGIAGLGHLAAGAPLARAA